MLRGTTQAELRVLPPCLRAALLWGLQLSLDIGVPRATVHLRLCLPTPVWAAVEGPWTAYVGYQQKSHFLVVPRGAWFPALPGVVKKGIPGPVQGPGFSRLFHVQVRFSSEKWGQHHLAGLTRRCSKRGAYQAASTAVQQDLLAIFLSQKRGQGSTARGREAGAQALAPSIPPEQLRIWDNHVPSLGLGFILCKTVSDCDLSGKTPWGVGAIGAGD